MAEDIAFQLKKYFAGEANDDVKKIVLLWLATIKNEKAVRGMLESDWEDILKSERVMISNTPRIWNAIQQKLHSQEFYTISKNAFAD